MMVGGLAYFVAQSLWLKKRSVGFVELHNLLKGVDISIEGDSTLPSDGKNGPRASAASILFCFTDITNVSQLAQMCDKVAVTHIQFVLEFLITPRSPTRKKTHNAELAFLVDRFVQLFKIKHHNADFDGRKNTAAA